MGDNLNGSSDRRTDSGRVLPVTPYEIWQYEKYGNFYKEKDPEPIADMDDLPALSIKIYANN
jgi:hypothetical protein